jgi:hypothetical protein
MRVIRTDGRDAIVEIETSHVFGRLTSREMREAMHWKGGQQLMSSDAFLYA